MADSPRFNKQTFQEWRHHPLTGVFLQLLRDQRADLMEAWGQGQDLDLRHQTKALLWGELADLAWSDYCSYYEIEETESGAE